MGISVPTTNLKKYTYIKVDQTIATVFASAYAHYLFLQDVDFSEIDEIGIHFEHRSNAANVTSMLSLEINRVTSIWDNSITNGLDNGWEFVDVSSYKGVRELGLLWDITGAGLPASCQINYLSVWGKKGLV